MLDLVQLNDASAPREVAHGHKFSAAGHPLTVKHRVVEALLDMGDDLRLLKGRHSPADFVSTKVHTRVLKHTNLETNPQTLRAVCLSRLPYSPPDAQAS